MRRPLDIEVRVTHSRACVFVSRVPRPAAVARAPNLYASSTTATTLCYSEVVRSIDKGHITDPGSARSAPALRWARRAMGRATPAAAAPRRAARPRAAAARRAGARASALANRRRRPRPTDVHGRLA